MWNNVTIYLLKIRKKVTDFHIITIDSKSIRKADTSWNIFILASCLPF